MRKAFLVYTKLEIFSSHYYDKILPRTVTQNEISMLKNWIFIDKEHPKFKETLEQKLESCIFQR